MGLRCQRRPVRIGECGGHAEDPAKLRRPLEGTLPVVRGSIEGHETAWEAIAIWQSNYRISYLIEDAISTVTIIKIGHRRDAYRN